MKNTVIVVSSFLVPFIIDVCFWRFVPPFSNLEATGIQGFINDYLSAFLGLIFLVWMVCAQITYRILLLGDFTQSAGLPSWRYAMLFSWLIIGFGYYAQTVVYPWPTNWPNRDLADTLYHFRGNLENSIAMMTIVLILPYLIILAILFFIAVKHKAGINQ